MLHVRWEVVVRSSIQKQWGERGRGGSVGEDDEAKRPGCACWEQHDGKRGLTPASRPLAFTHKLCTPRHTHTHQVKC